MKRILHKVIFTFAAVFCLSAVLMAQNVTVITVSNFAFSPANATIGPTDTIKFVWASGTHTATSDDGAGTADDGTTFNFSLNSSTPGPFKVFGLSSGSYPYHCQIHPTLMTGTITVSGPAAINDPKESKFEFSAAPNPFDDQLSMNINIGDKSVTDIKIYDLIGKEVASVNLAGKTGIHSYRVDTSNLKPGIYFCSVYSANGILETKKLFRRN